MEKRKSPIPTFSPQEVKRYKISEPSQGEVDLLRNEVQRPSLSDLQDAHKAGTLKRGCELWKQAYQAGGLERWELAAIAQAHLLYKSEEAMSDQACYKSLSGLAKSAVMGNKRKRERKIQKNVQNI